MKVDYLKILPKLERERHIFFVTMSNVQKHLQMSETKNILEISFAYVCQVSDKSEGKDKTRPENETASLRMPKRYNLL